MTTSNNENIQKKFGSRLRQIRQNMGLSQEELAHLSNLDRSYVVGVERGERNISLVNIHKIADALNISPKEFFND